MKRTKAQPPLSLEEFQHIIAKPLPTPEELFGLLDKFHSLLFDAFGYSFARTREGLKNTHSKKAAVWFRPQAIRFYVQDFLSQKGIEAQLIDETSDAETEVFSPNVLPNNGIAGNVYGFEYGIFKMFNGGLPPPFSDRRRELYSQGHLKGYQPVFPGLEVTAAGGLSLKPHLVYVWSITQRQLCLYLAIPKHYSLYATTPITLIPNPITTMKAQEAHEESRKAQMPDTIEG